MKTDAMLISNSGILSKPEQDAIREQLARVLASSWFRHSKRFPEFLRYTVEHALKGDTENIKERALAVEVFGRSAGSDLDHDSIVRVGAREVRKRLLQYYSAEGENNADFRRRIAESLGIMIGGLRVRTNRLREQLEELVSRCLESRRQELIHQNKRFSL